MVKVVSVRLILLTSLAASAALWAIPSSARGQIFVTNTGPTDGSDYIGEYTISGATINPSLISGLAAPDGVAVSGQNLFVTNSGRGTVGQYTTSGATVNSALISGLAAPQGIVVLGGNLYVANRGNGTIG
jgi:hypothetical protein